ncbi:MAG: hypothetical protein GY898_09965 [Proteobacteria bacterium]|nr:hypothetical protein [Pseudomonadota bacterium]
MSCRHHSLDDFSLPHPERHYAPDLGLEPVHLDIALGFDLAGRQAAGAVTTTFEARRSDARSVTLDATDFREVDVVDPDGHELSWSYDGSQLVITWSEAPGPGEQRRAEVRYRVISPLTGMLFSWPDELHPTRPRFLATDHETERARYWLPCIDHPTVRTPLDFHLRAGQEYTVLANGLRVGEEMHDDGTKTVHWKLKQPCPSYLVCLAVGDFVRASGGALGDVEIAFFGAPPHTEEHLQHSFGPTRSMLEWMTKKLDSAFPFPKYFQLCLPGIGGAMENISLVTWDDRFMADEVWRAEKGWLIDLVNVHEMAHSWFGDAIVCRDFSHVWLKESWATYMQSAWLEDMHGIDALHYELSELSRGYREEADKRYVRPIVTRDFDSSWDMYDGHLYPGGAFRLHMLRCELGDDDFWGGVRDYVKLFSGRVVETSDFRRTLEDRSGRSLAEFFEQWFERPGYPQLKARMKHSAVFGEAVVTIEQTQADDGAGVGLFRFDLEVAIETVAGDWITRTLAVSEATHSLTFPASARPLQVVIDPESKVLHKLVEWAPGNDLLIRSLAHAPTVPGRIQAARALAAKASPRAITVLRDRHADEPHWGVRIEIARALAAAGTQGAAQALARLLDQESDPKAMFSFAAACGRYRDPDIARALEAFLERDDLPYQARHDALVALGRQRGDAPLETLRAATQSRNWWRWTRRGALIGLGETRTEEARKFLVGRIAYGAEQTNVRQVAANALAQAAKWQERSVREQTLEVLTDLTRDPVYAVRQAAVGAIRTLGEPAGVGAMMAARRTLAPQDGPRIERGVAALRKQSGPGDQARNLSKQVDDLHTKLRKLQHRVATMEQRERDGDEDA